MTVPQLHYHSRQLEPASSGPLVGITPKEARWDYITFRVRRLVAGERWAGAAEGDEVCLVLLQGTCRISWNDGLPHTLGPREDVFAGYPHAVYLPTGTSFVLEAATTTEIAECRAPSDKPGTARVVAPEDCGFEIRGGGNATRQIVDILPPDFPADRLMICEVYTPSGNWSSYPPHKHDVDNPPFENDLEETYYFRMRQPEGYAFQRIYREDGSFDQTFMVRDGDLLLVRDGYHPFVTAYGFDAYYLNVLAGQRRSMACKDDPRYASFRREWPAPDPRLPLVPRPASAPSGQAQG
jgi:5-deoxy-glucuronate isomerase